MSGDYWYPEDVNLGEKIGFSGEMKSSMELGSIRMTHHP
jgi:hypothetical protein